MFTEGQLIQLFNYYKCISQEWCLQVWYTKPDTVLVTSEWETNT